MMRKANHRNVRKRRGMKNKSEMKFTQILVIIFITIALGYLTARFIIGPILGYNADESPIEKTSSLESVEKGYALQFGVFSTKEAAQKLADSLKQKGIDVEIVEAGNQYKVISPIIQTKDEALNKLDEIKDKDVEDVFIASF